MQLKSLKKPEAKVIDWGKLQSWLTILALLLTVIPFMSVQAAVDYTQGVTLLKGTQAKVWFKPITLVGLVDIHYLINGMNQQNFRMTNNNGTWNQTVSGLSNGTVLEYWFTYEKGGPLFNTVHFTYTKKSNRTPATLAFNPPGGAYTTAQSVTITAATPGATIRYTTDGSTPTATSTRYTAPIKVAETTTIKAIAIKSGMTNSAVASAAYTISTGGGNGTFPVILQNNTRGIWANSQIFILVFGMNASGLWCYLKPDGTMVPLNPADANAPGHLTKNGVSYANYSFALAQASIFTVPTYITGGRMYISIGSPMFIPIGNNAWGGPDLANPSDPNTDVVFDWYEFTYIFNQIPFGGNTTQVDMFGFPMTARLQQAAIGYDQTVGIALARDQIFSRYSSAVASAFRPLANNFRIVAPRSAAAFKPSGSQANYMQAYIDQTWSFYTTNQFKLTRLADTFIGQVVDGQLQFRKNDAGPFFLNKPTTTDVFACAGALASAGMSTIELELGAEFCAAFNRGVAVNTANWYKPTAYYTNSIKNDYAMFWHQIGTDKRAYGFAYDDVNDQSSVKILPNANPPTSLTIGIGW